MVHREEDLERIAEGLSVARALFRRHTPGAVESTLKSGGDLVTEADREVNEALRELLPRNGEGWLSEESVDDARRLQADRVWIVDPLDGTREFIEGVPEWCVSIGLVERGRAVAGGIANPVTEQVILGSLETGVTLNGEPVRYGEVERPEDAVVLASRSESRRGEWERFRRADFSVRPTGSVAYKLACVAAGLADATWTFVPKNEWDVAAGAALVAAGGGMVRALDGRPPGFNRRNTLLDGLLAFSPACRHWSEGFAEELLRTRAGNA